MKVGRRTTLGLLSGIWVGSALPVVAATPAAPSKGEQILAQAAQNEKFTLVMFWRENNPLTHDIAKKLTAAAKARPERMTATSISVTDPLEKRLVDKFDVSRAPMPMVLAVAPNGAITGVYSKKFEDSDADHALVSPGMTECLKGLQAGKLVLIHWTRGTDAPLPKGIQDFRRDPDFQKRTEVVTLDMNDPEEKSLLQQLEIDVRQTKAPTVAFFAPPGVLIGTFSGNVAKIELARKLHDAGKCCDDPNCKHAKQR